MNIYKSLNELTNYIDNNLEEKINYNDLAKILGVNVYTMQRLFTMIAGITLSDYIRKRKLSNAGFDLYKGNLKVIDVAVKYGYNNATSFSRAFFKFHGIKPSVISRNTKLKNFPRIVFNEDINITSELNYEIVNLDSFDLYGICIKTNNLNIRKEAPKFFEEIQNKYFDKYGDVRYGITTYDLKHEETQKYYCLYEQKISEFEHIKIPESKWLRFRINSQEALDIQEITQKFYHEFLPSCKYNLKDLPELEYYHDDITDFLVAII